MSERRRELERHARSFLGHYSKEPISGLGASVGAMLHEWQGLHHFEPRDFKRVDWDNDHHILLRLDRVGPGGSLATVDFNGLTRLVFLAHDYGIRTDVRPVMNRLELLFHQRKQRDGSLTRRHPTIEHALAEWRESNQSHDLEQIFASKESVH